jgi:hypothetical protein
MSRSLTLAMGQSASGGPVRGYQFARSYFYGFVRGRDPS